MHFSPRELMKQKLVPAVLSIALGIVIIIARRAALDLQIKIIGGLIIAGGVAYMARYLASQQPEDEGTKMPILPVGIAVVIGLVLILCAGTIVDIFPVIMGVSLILNGLSHLTAAGMDPENRVLACILGVITIVLGVLIVLQPGAIANMVMVFIGAALIVNGLFDLYMVRRVNSMADNSTEE